MIGVAKKYQAYSTFRRIGLADPDLYSTIRSISYGTLIITNSTFSGNSANSNGGGISRDSTSSDAATLRNTIGADSPSGGKCSGMISDGGGSLVWGDTTCPGKQADPKLGSLGDNGGLTQTMALLSGSAAIDAGNDAICVTAFGAPNYGAGGFD